MSTYVNLTRNFDGSYTFVKNGYPYNCPNMGEWLEEYAQVHAYAQAHPDEVTIGPEHESPTLDELKTAKRAEVWGAGDAILTAVKANYTQAEIESWSKQEQGAKDLAAGETTTEAAHFVAGIATLRGIPVDTLRDKILANVAAYGQLCTAVIGTQQRLDDLVKAAQTADDLTAITWPETLG
ncbi:hypothetical protein [Pyramidobacter piscolens]|uniref:hypothetical protein n=1 Tax=Pyramidobacter piscolens TaxID=638849 RepID=UPI002AB1A2DC|nr:hypothetical protein [Pyramidobacter piscolens]